MKSEKRFKLDFDIDKIKQRFFVKIGKKVQIIDQERNHRIRDLYKACEVLNEQQDTISKQLDKIIELQDKYRILEFNHSRLEKRNKAQYEKIGEQQATILLLKDFIKKEFPKSYKHILEGLDE